MSASTLVLQQQLQHFLLTENPAIVQHIVGTSRVCATMRLAIYRDAYYSRLIEALSTSYPILLEYLGEEAFNRLAKAYIQEYPSIYRSIRWFGDKLSEFLGTYTEYTAHPYLAELALFEWTLTLTFDSKDAPVLSLEAMAAVAPECWETLEFIAHPSCHRITFNCNAVALWKACSAGQTPPAPVKTQAPTEWILWRKQYINYYQTLPPEEAMAWDGLMQGKPFGQICEDLSQWIPREETPARAAGFLKNWIASGFIFSLVLA